MSSNAGVWGFCKTKEFIAGAGTGSGILFGLMFLVVLPGISDNANAIAELPINELTMTLDRLDKTINKIDNQYSNNFEKIDMKLDKNNEDIHELAITLCKISEGVECN